jgi:FtsZ-binding cell division protein ZapB
MSTSLESPLPSHYRSKQEFLASLPPWRRLLAKLNWHPTIEKKVASYASEQRAKQLRLETEKIKRDTEQIKIEIVQIRNETEQLRSENERLKKEDEQFAELDAKIAALWPSSNANATPVPPIETSSIP